VATGKISTDTTHHAVSQRVAELLVYNQQRQSIRENSKQKKITHWTLSTIAAEIN